MSRFLPIVLLIMAQQFARAESMLDGVRHRTTTADAVAEQYALNPLQADRFYRDQVYTIGGSITVIATERDVHVDLDVPVRCGENVYGIRCFFANTDGVERLRAGTSVSIVGKIDGLRGAWIIVKGCYLPR